MSILLATTKVQLLAPAVPDEDDPDDWGGAPDPNTGYIASGDPVRAHLSGPSGTASFSSEELSNVITYKLLCDPCPLRPDMQVRDLTSGIVYNVDWCQPRYEPIPHVVAGVTFVSYSA